jgi:hypothetical protein
VVRRAIECDDAHIEERRHRGAGVGERRQPPFDHFFFARAHGDGVRIATRSRRQVIGGCQDTQ